MKINVLKPDNNCVIIDEEYYRYLKEKAELNAGEIEKIAEEKYLKYIKEGGTIKLTYQINGVPYVFRRDLIDELNYSERDYPISVTNKIKFAIADDITVFLDEHFAHYKEDCKSYVQNVREENKKRYNRELRFWKYTCFAVVVIALINYVVGLF